MVGNRRAGGDKVPGGIGYAVQSQDRRGRYEEWMASHLDSAEVVLLIARQQRELRREDGVEGGATPIELSAHLLHNYVRVLCLAGEVYRARDVLHDILHPDTNAVAATECLDDDDDAADDDKEGGEEGIIRHEWTDISLETFTLLSSSFVRLGDMERVDEVLDMCREAGYESGLPSYAAQRIDGARRRKEGGV